MEVASVVSKIAMWTALVITGAFQVLAILGISMNNQQAIALNKPEKQYNLTFLVLCVVLFVLAVVLFTVLKKRRYIGVIIAVVAAFVLVGVALDLGRVFAVSIQATGEQGLSTWRMIWRHMSPVLITAFMICAWLFGRAADKKREAAALAAGPGKYHFDDKILFADEDKPAVQTKK